MGEELKCSCAEVEGEDPDCVLHGVSVEIWATYTDDQCMIEPEIDSFTVRRKCQQHLASLPSGEASEPPYKRALFIEFDGKEPVAAVYTEDGKEVMRCTIRCDALSPTSTSGEASEPTLLSEPRVHAGAGHAPSSATAIASDARNAVIEEANVSRDISGETFYGFRVAAYRETHPEHGDKYGHAYSEHWSTPNTRDPRVKVERMFTEEQLLAALTKAPPSRESELPAPTVRITQDMMEADAIEYLAREHDKAGRYLVAVDIRNGNIGGDGVRWFDSKIVLRALVALREAGARIEVE